MWVDRWVPPWVGKVTIGLASHRPCVTNNSGLSTYGLNGLWKWDEHPAYAPSEYGPPLPLPFFTQRDTAVPAEGNGDLQTLICVLVARPRWRPTLSNPVPWPNWMAAYLGYTLWMKTLFRGWPVIVDDTHTRRRWRLKESTPLPTWLTSTKSDPGFESIFQDRSGCGSICWPVSQNVVDSVPSWHQSLH